MKSRRMHQKKQKHRQKKSQNKNLIVFPRKWGYHSDFYLSSSEQYILTI